MLLLFSHVWRCIPILYYVLFSIIFCLVGLGIGYFIRGIIGKKKKTSAEMQAKEIEERSRKEAENRKRELEIQAKDELYRLRAEFDKEVQPWNFLSEYAENCAGRCSEET